MRYLAQVARNSRRFTERIHGPTVSITLTLHVPEQMPSCTGGPFYVIHFTPSHFSSQYQPMLEMGDVVSFSMSETAHMMQLLCEKF